MKRNREGNNRIFEMLVCDPSGLDSYIYRKTYIYPMTNVYSSYIPSAYLQAP